ncbi:hypothetical protein D3C83_302110 [compost metagenome]
MLQETRACPAGFPVKGVIEGRGGTIRLAFPPEYPYYAGYYFTTCFRTLEEARAWGYTYRGAR